MVSLRNRRWIRIAIPGAFLLVAALVALGAGIRSRGGAQGGVAKPEGPGTVHSQPGIWFEDLAPDRQRLSLTEGDARAVLGIVRDALAGGVVKKELPAHLRADEKARILFLSASEGQTPARVGLGTGRGFVAALEQAVHEIKRLDPKLVSARWLKLDLVDRVGEPEEVGARGAVAVDRSLHGIAFPRSSGLAFLAEEMVANTLVNSDARLRMRNVAKYLGRESPRRRLESTAGREQPPSVRRFTTQSYFLEETEVLPLYRGHRRRQELSADLVFSAARNGGEYLRRAVTLDGRFVYSYLPKTDEEKDEYNMVRHAGTVYSMLDLWETSRDPKLRAAAERATNHLLQFVVPYGEEASVLAFGGKIKLGGVALAAVALTEHAKVTGDPTHLPTAQRLCRYIQQSQRDNGEFIHQRYHPRGEIRRDFISEYYPGEALLALVRLHAEDDQDIWLDVAERGARYLIEVRDRGIETPDLIHDHWLLYALNELYRQRPDPLYLNHSMRIAKAITLKQNRAPSLPDYLGSYYNPPRSTPTATRSEGLIAAYQLARDFNRPLDAQSIWEAIELGVGFQLQTQMLPERALYLTDPARCLGGFTRSLTNFEIRIDYVQHNVSALISLYRIGIEG